MGNINILWVDDEIEFLKPHILFLEKKNYVVTTCKSAANTPPLKEMSPHNLS